MEAAATRDNHTEFDFATNSLQSGTVSKERKATRTLPPAPKSEQRHGPFRAPRDSAATPSPST